MGYEKNKLVKLKSNSTLMSPTNDGVVGLQFAKTNDCCILALHLPRAN